MCSIVRVSQQDVVVVVVVLHEIPRNSTSKVTDRSRLRRMGRIFFFFLDFWMPFKQILLCGCRTMNFFMFIRNLNFYQSGRSTRWNFWYFSIGINIVHRHWRRGRWFLHILYSDEILLVPCNFVLFLDGSLCLCFFIHFRHLVQSWYLRLYQHLLLT